MFELLGLVLVILMAKHGKRGRYNPNFRVVRFRTTIALSTLANGIMITGAMFGSADGQYRTVAIDGQWSLHNLTASEGPLTVGFAHNDYSVTEIKEWFDSASSISLGNKVENERRKRVCRQAGVFSGNATEEALNDGKFMRTKFRMKCPIGSAPNVWVHNGSGATLTTGATVTISGKAYIIDY